MIIHKTGTHVFQHVLGQYMSQNLTNFGYIPIPKNASSALKSYFSKVLNFEYNYNYNICTKKKYIVCLRDPLDRWFSGVTEYLFINFGNHHSNTKKRTIDINNKDILKFIFDRKIFDAHTEPQINFVSSLNKNDIHFFKVDSDLIKNICKFTTEMFDIKHSKCVININYVNLISETPEKQTILNILKNYAELNPHYIEEIKDCYKADYELINSVKYYGTN